MRLAGASFAALLVVFVREPLVVGGGMRLLDAAKPLGADGMGEDRLQPVVGPRLLNGGEPTRALFRWPLPGRHEPKIGINQLEPGRVALDFESEGDAVAVLRRREQALAPARRVLDDRRLDDALDLGRTSWRSVPNAGILPRPKTGLSALLGQVLVK